MIVRNLGLGAIGFAGLVLFGCNSGPSDVTVARRVIKTASDSGAKAIDFTPIASTVEDIAATPVPDQSKLARRQPFEEKVYTVEATIKSVQLKPDGDYYMVLKGEKGGTTVVEVPDPALCKDSAAAEKIAATRKAIEEKYHPTKEIKTVDDKAEVSGVGFLGWGGKPKQGSTGYSGPRLMPGTGIEFKP